jgi:nicotinamide mononucleotide (NMN) deamidase PncC
LAVNSVSEEVAGRLAVEISKKFVSDYGLGITGYATIVPECEEDGIFAFFSLCYKNEVVVTKKISSKKEGTWPVQLDYTNQCLEQVLAWLEDQQKN